MATERFTLDDHEVVVLNHVLYTLTERDDFDALVPHPADRQALHNLVCLLEREDPAALAGDYQRRVEQARRALLPDDD